MNPKTNAARLDCAPQNTKIEQNTLRKTTMMLPLLAAGSAGVVILLAVLAIVVVAFIFGSILGYAAKKFHVEVDPRIEKIAEILPGANCGGCGYPGCSGYAEAIVNEGAAIDRCAPGGAAVAAKIAEIMGLEVSAAEPKVAVVLCRGYKDVAAERFEYVGVRSCRAASLLGVGAGHKACPFGCLGFGDCVAACPFGAIVMTDRGVPEVLRERCVGCGKCVEACPRGVITLLPRSKTVFVACRNTQKGAKAKRVCSNACIACKRCEKVCKFDAIKVESNLARIDYEKCKNCGRCAQECPQDVIEDVRRLDKRLKEAA